MDRRVTFERVGSAHDHTQTGADAPVVGGSAITVEDHASHAMETRWNCQSAINIMAYFELADNSAPGH